MRATADGETSPSATPPIGVVVVNYGSHQLLAANLVSLPAAELGVRIVVVDNLSTEAERRATADLARQNGWDFVACAGNDGFGAGVNVGLARAAEIGCTTFLILNPDVVITSEVVTALWAQVTDDPLALVTPRIVAPDGTIAFAGSQVYVDTGRIKRLHPPQDVDAVQVVRSADLGPRRARAWLPGTCLAVHADLLSRAGAFDEDFFLYWEDVDLSARCEDVGGRLVIRHDLQVVHDEGGTQERADSRALSSRYYYWNCRNRMLFAARHLPRRAILRWMVHTPTESWQILMRGGRRQLLHSLAPLGATIRGSVSGLVLAGRAVVGRRPASRPRPELPSPVA